MRLTINGTSRNLRLNHNINPKIWNHDKQKAIGRSAEAYDINNSLCLIRSKILYFQRQLELDGIEVTAPAIINRLLGIDDTPTLLELYREHNDSMNKLVGTGICAKTAWRYESTYTTLQAFIKQVYKSDDIRLRLINHEFILKYQIYLKTQVKAAHNTIVKHLKNLKKVIRIAQRNHWVKNEPFEGIKTREVFTEREFLTKEELERIISKEISIERIDIVRDIFVFCCFSGLAFTDVQQLTPEHISTDNHGQYWIHKTRQKTKVTAHIPLLKIPLMLIEKYKNDKKCIEKDVVFPVPCNQRMNTYLSEIADICGIKKRLTTHVARHTFATTVTLANNVSIDNVAKMLGHTKTEQTRQYARVLDSSIKKDMIKVDDVFDI